MTGGPPVPPEDAVAAGAPRCRRSRALCRAADTSTPCRCRSMPVVQTLGDRLARRADSRSHCRCVRAARNADERRASRSSAPDHDSLLLILRDPSRSSNVDLQRQPERPILETTTESPFASTTSTSDSRRGRGTTVIVDRDRSDVLELLKSKRVKGRVTDLSVPLRLRSLRPSRISSCRAHRPAQTARARSGSTQPLCAKRVRRSLDTPHTASSAAASASSSDANTGVRLGTGSGGSTGSSPGARGEPRRREEGQSECCCRNRHSHSATLERLGARARELSTASRASPGEAACERPDTPTRYRGERDRPRPRILDPRRPRRDAPQRRGCAAADDLRRDVRARGEHRRDQPRPGLPRLRRPARSARGRPPGDQRRRQPVPAGSRHARPAPGDRRAPAALLRHPGRSRSRGARDGRRHRGHRRDPARPARRGRRGRHARAVLRLLRRDDRASPARST